MTDLKEIIQFIQNDIEDKITDFKERLNAGEKEIKSLRGDAKVIQSTKTSGTIDRENKLVDLAVGSGKSNLRIDGIKKHRNKTWEDCMNKVYEVLENNLEINIDHIVTASAHQTGVKSESKPRVIVVQFNKCNDETRTLRNYKRLMGKTKSIYKDFSKETLAIRKELGKVFNA